MASLGYPEIRPVFKDLHPLVSPVSICEPGETNALEFNDGKVMLSEMTSFKELNWCALLINPGHDRILEEMNSSDLIALVDWANLVHCSNIWEGIYKDILPALKEPKKFFFDIADPSRSSKEELEEVLEIIASYSSYGDMYLGINENETYILYEKIFGMPANDISLQEAGGEIYKLMNITGLLIHPVDRSLMITSLGTAEEKGKVVAELKISTGGGDNFNAGFCLGLLLGYSTEESMITGMATSGFYVKYGKSPAVGEIAGYLEE